MKTVHLVRNVAVVLLLTAGASTAALGFGGCGDSPENPTLLLALIGGAAAVLPRLKQRWRGRNRDHQ